MKLLDLIWYCMKRMATSSNSSVWLTFKKGAFRPFFILVLFALLVFQYQRKAMSAAVTATFRDSTPLFIEIFTLSLHKL